MRPGLCTVMGPCEEHGNTVLYQSGICFCTVVCDTVIWPGPPLSLPLLLRVQLMTHGNGREEESSQRLYSTLTALPCPTGVPGGRNLVQGSIP